MDWQAKKKAAADRAFDKLEARIKNHPDIEKAVQAFIEHVNAMSSEEFQATLDRQDGVFTQMYKDGLRPVLLDAEYSETEQPTSNNCGFCKHRTSKDVDSVPSAYCVLYERFVCTVLGICDSFKETANES